MRFSLRAFDEWQNIFLWSLLMKMVPKKIANLYSYVRFLDNTIDDMGKSREERLEFLEQEKNLLMADKHQIYNQVDITLQEKIMLLEIIETLAFDAMRCGIAVEFERLEENYKRQGLLIAELTGIFKTASDKTIANVYWAGVLFDTACDLEIDLKAGYLNCPAADEKGKKRWQRKITVEGFKLLPYAFKLLVSARNRYGVFVFIISTRFAYLSSRFLFVR